MKNTVVQPALRPSLQPSLRPSLQRRQLCSRNSVPEHRRCNALTQHVAEKPHCSADPSTPPLASGAIHLPRCHPPASVQSTCLRCHPPAPVPPTGPVPSACPGATHLPGATLRKRPNRTDRSACPASPLSSGASPLQRPHSGCCRKATLPGRPSALPLALGVPARYCSERFTMQWMAAREHQPHENTGQTHCKDPAGYPLSRE